MRVHLQIALILILNSLNIRTSSTQNLNDQQVIVEGPADQQAKIGEQVVLKCRIRNLKGEPQWCIDDFCLGVDKRSVSSSNVKSINQTQTLKGRPRHRIVGDKSKGEFHLLIEPIQLQDNMFYYCMVTAASETIKAVKSKKVFLTVLTYPQSLNLDNPVHVSLNKPSSIQCSARQSRPPVKILIALNGNLITDESRYKTEIVQIPISMTKEDSSAEQQATLDSTMNSTSKRIVHFAANQQINLEQMRESFYDTITALTIEDVTMRMDGHSVECFVHSFLYQLDASQPVVNKKIGNFNLISFHNNMMNTKSFIQVDYAPEVSLKILSTNKVLKEEDVISLVCETKATPPIQSYKWYIGKNYLSGVVDSNLNLKLRREMHLKTVTCEASNTVASVKASIQLNILYKPSFVKGSKSFMLIDKNACNKPLTLDCQVNSNPGANITWYRRRVNPNKIYQFVLDKKKITSLFSKIDLTKNNDENNYYYDELVGTGPTYTIASFNCANLLMNVKNLTTESPSRLVKINTNSTTSSSNADSSKHKANKLPAKFKINSTSLITKKLIVRNLDEEDEDENVDLDYTNDYSDTEDETEEDDDEAYSSTQINYNDYNDFGIYICEASNRLSNNHELALTRRYIKLNPIGAPVLKALPSNSVSTSSVTSNNNDEIISELMKSVDGNLIEVAANLGASISLVCLIEPLPHFESIVWLNEMGKIIPNSKYSIYEHKSKLTSSSSSGSSSETKTNSNQNQRSMYRNFKVKYENLTLLSSKSDDLEENEEEQTIAKTEGLITNDGDVNLMRSILFIKNLREQDLGIYKCKASNSYGSNSVSILLREKTLMDKFNLNNYLFLTLTTSSTIMIFISFVVIMVCLVSRRARQFICCCCCCCCFRCARRILKEKDLLGQQCEQNSDKSINEWLVSSKLSNDTANGSLINSANSTNTTNNVSHSTAMSLLNQNELNEHMIQACNMNTLMNTLTNNLKANKIIMNTPSHLRLELNGTALLADDLDDDSEMNLEKSHNRLFLTENTAATSANAGNTFKRDENRSSSHSNANACYQSVSQFNRYLVSSPLLSSSSKNEEDKLTSDDTNNTSPSSASTALSKTLGPTMLIRSPPNFSAKISTVDTKSEQQRLLNNTTNASNVNSSTIKLNSFMFNRNNFDKTIEKDYYENTNMDDFNENVDDLTKILQDTNYRLSDLQETNYNFSDLFNELSPINNVTTTSNTKTTSNSSYMTTPNLSIKTNLKANLFQQFPSLINVSPPPPPPPPPPQMPPNHSMRQSNQSANNFNKFPNPFTVQANLTSASTSKFYSNFYKNTQEQYENANDSSKETDLKTPLSQHPPTQHIITTSSSNGNNKYQTHV